MKHFLETPRQKFFYFLSIIIINKQRAARELHSFTLVYSHCLCVEYLFLCKILLLDGGLNPAQNGEEPEGER